jgi:hypothetical protein
MTENDPYKDVTRVEVIDNNGRVYAKHSVERVWLSEQDDGRTLKVFVTFEEQEEICID